MRLAPTMLLVLFPALLIARSAAVEPPDDFDEAVDAFFERYFDFYPTAAARAGLHEYDPLLGRRDAGAIADWIAELKAFESRFAAFDPAALDEDRRVDRELILREVRGDLFWLEEVGEWRRDPRFYAGQMDMTLLLMLDYAPLEERMRAIVARLERFPDLVAAARANVEDPPRPFVETALITYRGWPPFLEGDLTEALADVEDDELQADFRAARDAAVESLAAYAEHLEADVLPTADGDYALGPERYRRMNALLAGVDLPIEELDAMGREELARIQALADSLAAEIAPDAPAHSRVVAAFDSLGHDKPGPDAIVSTAAAGIEDLRAFTGRVATVLPGDVEVLEIPPYARTNFAYIFIPGPYEEAVNTGFYFIQPVEEEWSDEVTEEFLERNNRWSILNVSGHEAYPGHYHHFNHVNRSPTRAQRLLTAYVTTEGWAHYTEEMSWRRGLADSSPRLGLGMVQDALLRAVRYIVSIGLHTGGMTVEQAEEMFATVAFQDSVNARQQALRGTYDPEYLNYTLGKMMIRKLRADLEAADGEAFDLASFHDGFMAKGAPPVPWIGRRMTGREDWKPLGPGRRTPSAGDR